MTFTQFQYECYTNVTYKWKTTTSPHTIQSVCILIVLFVEDYDILFKEKLFTLKRFHKWNLVRNRVHFKQIYIHKSCFMNVISPYQIVFTFYGLRLFTVSLLTVKRCTIKAQTRKRRVSQLYVTYTIRTHWLCVTYSEILGLSSLLTCR